MANKNKSILKMLMIIFILAITILAMVIIKDKKSKSIDILCITEQNNYKSTDNNTNLTCNNGSVVIERYRIKTIYVDKIIYINNTVYVDKCDEEIETKPFTLTYSASCNKWLASEKNKNNVDKDVFEAPFCWLKSGRQNRTIVKIEDFDDRVDGGCRINYLMGC